MRISDWSSDVCSSDLLIASNKVEGTAVYGRDGERLGHIYNFMVDKVSGHVEYAVMAYGGFLRMGERYFPLPWQTLDYDTRRGGYRIDMRSEEHTSELQSLMRISYAVFCLNKKKITNKKTTTLYTQTTTTPTK